MGDQENSARAEFDLLLVSREGRNGKDMGDGHIIEEYIGASIRIGCMLGFEVKCGRKAVKPELRFLLLVILNP